MAAARRRLVMVQLRRQQAVVRLPRQQTAEVRLPRRQAAGRQAAGRLPPVAPCMQTSLAPRAQPRSSQRNKNRAHFCMPIPCKETLQPRVIGALCRLQGPVHPGVHKVPVALAIPGPFGAACWTQRTVPVQLVLVHTVGVHVGVQVVVRTWPCLHCSSTLSAMHTLGICCSSSCFHLTNRT